MIKGYVHSIQTLGAIDGPGVRFVVFMQGCPLRCGCCHNPDTWKFSEGNEYNAEELIEKAVRYREYFGKDGGITASGGEPLMQADFVKELFKLSHSKKINTCLDTSGCVINDSVIKLLDETDRVLLDIKYTDNEDYKKYTGMTLGAALDFLSLLNNKNIPVTVRQVIIPTLNDTDESILRLNKIIEKYECVDSAELLPFKKMCSMKYDNTGIEFPFKNLPEPSPDKLRKLNNLLYPLDIRRSLKYN